MTGDLSRRTEMRSPSQEGLPRKETRVYVAAWGPAGRDNMCSLAALASRASGVRGGGWPARVPLCTGTKRLWNKNSSPRRESQGAKAKFMGQA